MTNFRRDYCTLIEILWSNLTLDQNNSWILLSAGTPIIVLSRPEYSQLALQCRQKVKSRNYFAQLSNSTTKFLSVNLKKITWSKQNIQNIEQRTVTNNYKTIEAADYP